MLLEKAALGDTTRAAQQRQRAVDQARRDPWPDLGVELGQTLLGDADIGPQQAIGMSESDGQRYARLGDLRFLLHGRSLAHDLGRGLVRPQPLEDGMPYHV